MKNNIPAELFDWLSDSGSFMLRLKRHGIENAQIRIKKEGWCFPEQAERVALNLPLRTYVWGREVEIYSENTIWMFARTVIPQQTLTGNERQLQHLKTRSLGSVLFKYPDLIRSEFDFFCIESNSAWHKKITKDLSMKINELWARSSLFTVSDKSLLLTEVFFPGVEKI